MTRTILLTGTSSGIGAAAVAAFLDDGWNVVATARDPAQILPGRQDDGLLRGRLDVTEEGSIEAAFRAAEERFGAVDVVVNNAGIGLGGPLEAIAPDRLRAHFEVNVIGVAQVCRIAAAHMRPRGQGLIINVTSLAGRVGIPFLSPYCATKFAVEGLTEALHYELGLVGLRVKLVEPGGARTRFAHPWADHPAYAPAADRVLRQMTQGAAQAAPPEEVARVILQAAKDESDQLRYAATDAVPALAMLRDLPEAA